METKRKMSFGQRPDHGSLVRKVEQDHRGLIGLQRHLKSYACEPRTPKLFQEREALSQALENMKKNNLQLLNDLKDRSPHEMQPQERFRIQHRLYQDLENKVIAYMGEARQFS